MPPSSTALRSRPASSSSIAGPRGWPRSSMAPYPRMVTAAPYRPRGRVSIVMTAGYPPDGTLRPVPVTWDGLNESIENLRTAIALTRPSTNLLPAAQLEPMVPVSKEESLGHKAQDPPCVAEAIREFTQHSDVPGDRSRKSIEGGPVPPSTEMFEKTDGPAADSHPLELAGGGPPTVDHHT